MVGGQLKRKKQMRIVKVVQTEVHVFVTDKTEEELPDKELAAAAKMYDVTEWVDCTMLHEESAAEMTTIENLRETYGDIVDCIEEKISK